MKHGIEKTIVLNEMAFVCVPIQFMFVDVLFIPNPSPSLAEQKLSTRIDCRTGQKFENNRCMWLCFLLNLQINTLVDINFI